MPRVADLVFMEPAKPLLDWVTEPPLSKWKWDSRGHTFDRMQERGIGMFEVFCAVIDPDKEYLDTKDPTRKIYIRGDVEVVMHEASSTCLTVIDRYEKLRTVPRKPLIPEGTIPTEPAPTITTTEDDPKPGAGNKTGCLAAVKERILAKKKPGQRFTADDIIAELGAEGHDFPADSIRRSVWALSRKAVIVKVAAGRSRWEYYVPFPVETTKPAPAQRTRPPKGSGTLIERALADMRAWLAGREAGEEVNVGQFFRDYPEWKASNSGQSTCSAAMQRLSRLGELVVSAKPRTGPYLYLVPGKPAAWPPALPEPTPDPIPEPVSEPDLSPLEEMTAVHPSQTGYTPQDTAVDGELVPQPLNSGGAILASALPADGDWVEIASFVAGKDVEIDLEQLTRTGRVFLVARRKPDGE